MSASAFLRVKAELLIIVYMFRTAGEGMSRLRPSPLSRHSSPLFSGPAAELVYEDKRMRNHLLMQLPVAPCGLFKTTRSLGLNQTRTQNNVLEKYDQVWEETQLLSPNQRGLLCLPPLLGK